jgi:hypothetical protein
MSRARYRIMLSTLGVGLTAWMLRDSGFLAAAFFSTLVGTLFFAVGYFLDPVAGAQKLNKPRVHANVPDVRDANGMGNQHHMQYAPQIWSHEVIDQGAVDGAGGPDSSDPVERAKWGNLGAGPHE